MVADRRMRKAERASVVNLVKVWQRANIVCTFAEAIVVREGNRRSA